MELLALLAAGIFLYVQQAKKFLDNIRFKFIDIKLDWSKTLASALSKVFLVFKFDIINTTDFEGKLLVLHLDIFYKGNQIATVDSKEPLVFGKKATTRASFPVTISTLNTVKKFKEVFNDMKAGRDIAVTIKGYADVTAGRVNINETKMLNV